MARRRGSPGGAGFGVFFAFAVVASIAGFAILVWKVTTARQLARQGGMSPGLATGMTLLTDDGLAATYLASSLRPQPTSPVAPAAPPPTAAPPTATVAVRLAELKSLLDDGIVTQAEYDGRRQAIIDSV